MDVVAIVAAALSFLVGSVAFFAKLNGKINVIAKVTKEGMVALGNFFAVVSAASADGEYTADELKAIGEKFQIAVDELDDIPGAIKEALRK